MALRPDEFYQHALAAADDERRLPLARMTGWDISPFEPDGLRVAPLRPPVLPEPARPGEDPSDCGSCRVAAHHAGPRLPHRGWRRTPAHLVLRPARGTDPAVRVVDGRLG